MRLKYLPVLVLLFTGCSKSNPVPTSVVGDWVWVKSTGGLANTHFTPQTTGRSWELVLRSDLACLQSGDFTSAGTGTYSLTTETSSQETSEFLNITCPGQAIKYKYTFISQDTLRLDNNVEVDGLSNFFVKR